MLKPLLIIFSTLCLSLVGFLVFKQNESDFITYQKLVEASDPSCSGEILSYSQQKRENVCKEIWYRANEPLNIYIESQESELFFFQQENQMEVVEELGLVHATCQEKLYYVLEDGREATLEENGKYLIKGSDPQVEESWLTNAEGLTPMQEVRYFEAEKASYCYNTQLFLAQNVFLKKYKIKGHDRLVSFENETPIMSGKAESIEFTLRGKKWGFQAHKLKATFNPKEEKL